MMMFMPLLNISLILQLNLILHKIDSKLILLLNLEILKKVLFLVSEICLVMNQVKRNAPGVDPLPYWLFK
jgi:hypothetical protein